MRRPSVVRAREPQSLEAPVSSQGPIPRRTLGRTAEQVSMIGLGGYHLGLPTLSDDDAVRIVRAALDEGVNFLDNSWDYHEGKSELRVGKALADGYRERAFVMTKIDARTRAGAERQIEQSLRRLDTDRIDLLQFHEVIRMDDPARIFDDDGAWRAVQEAQKAGKIRYIGFTGHKSPAIHRKMLATAAEHEFAFDTVQMPLNVMDAHYESFGQTVLPILVENGIGVLGMKPMGDGTIVEKKLASPVECLHYAMNLPTSVVITGCESMKDLEQALDAARTFAPLSEEQVSNLLARTAPRGSDGQYETYRTTLEHDSTTEHPQWLG
jgi:aryl-alcohol dehydrogenase-like predicted oxidoreductase